MNGGIIEIYAENFNRCASIWDREAQSALADEFYQELCSGTRRIFVYAMDDEYLADISLVYETKDADYTIIAQRAYVSHLFVKEAYRRQGIGRRLVGFICALAMEAGYKELSIGVNLDNYPAIRLYSEAGFNRILKVDADEQGAYLKLLNEM